jgi:hypothetical protein
MIAFDPADVNNVEPSIDESVAPLVLHWADSIFFEKVCSA